MTKEEQQRFLNVRRQVIAQRFSKLNDMQRKAVLTTEGPLLLLAGAGSGKTTVLIHRIANLITYGCAGDSSEIPEYVTAEDLAFLESYAHAPTAEQAGRAQTLCALHRAEPWSILAITFTNKAANQLKERLQAMLGQTAQDIWAMTFHSACCRILRRDIDRLGYDRHFVIFDTADSLRLLKQVTAELGMDEKSFSPRSVLTVISRAKDQMILPEEFAQRAEAENDFRMEQVARLYLAYQTRLRTANALDFDDIILLTVQLLQKHEDVRNFYCRKFRYVMIDEYQDTNLMQSRLAELLTGDHRNICVVGDDDQSIYKFRGATIENILEFEKQYPGAKLIRMEQNYRSVGSILRCANAVIANNLGRKGKTLWTEKEIGEKVQVYEADNENEEADFVASRIFRAAEKGSFKDCAVLYRTNAQSNALERAFQHSAIPYRIIGGHRFFDYAEIKDMLAYLYFLNDPADDFHLLRIINNPPRGIGTKTLEMASRQAAAAGKPLYEVISHAKQYPCLERAVAKLMDFAALAEDCRGFLETMELPDFYEEILQRTGYLAMLESKNDFESEARADNVRELKSSILNYCEKEELPTLSGFLEEIALFTDIEQYDPDADAVVMMTMHAAKGLEFPHVCLVGFEEGLFPGGSALGDDEELEEERRLCYVAITRAKQTLAISYACRRMLYGRTTYNRPSRFLAELPEDSTYGKPLQRNKQAYHDEDGLYSDVPRKQTKTYSTIVTQEKPSAKLQLSVGDMVVHKQFGKGMVLTVMPMGNDALLEVAFDLVGTKRLMANSAVQYMKKQ